VALWLLSGIYLMMVALFSFGIGDWNFQHHAMF
jgi:hypothetical protein